MMSKIKKLSDKEILEDMSAMLRQTADFERTISMIKLTDDETLIFKRAAHQLKKERPNMQILRKAYDIFVAKSYTNTAFNHHDSQAILSESAEPRGIFGGFSSSPALKVFAVIVVILIALKALNG